jgi:phage replication O-like protein O
MTDTPQTENGFTRIANELMDALARTRISGEARQVLDAIIRKTYGWGKTSDDISLSQFMIMTGLSKSTICKAIRKLISMNIIIKRGCSVTLFTKQGKAVTSTYSVQKDHKYWKPLPKKETLRRGTKKGDLDQSGPDELLKKETVSDVAKKGNLEQSIPGRLPKKETLSDVPQNSKDVTQNNNFTLPKNSPTIESLKKKAFSPDSDEHGLAKLLFDLILKRDSEHPRPDMEMWAGHIDCMIRLDGWKPDDIKSVIVWCQSGKTTESKFWGNNILSTDKLRQKFPQLRLKMEEDNIKHGPRKDTQGSEYFKPIPKPVRTSEGREHIKQLFQETRVKVFGKGYAKEAKV